MELQENKSKTIAVLLTCHNRRLKTLSCLESLYTSALPEGFSLDVFLVDDGSTDGTGLAVTQNFPSVMVIQGTGDLFWNRGMNLAWKIASNKKDYDFYLWLNDDTLLFPDALETIITAGHLTNFSAIICGPTCGKDTRQVTYSGAIHKQKGPLAPNGNLQECNMVHGNFLLVPKLIFDTIGNLDWTFRHALGDFDYGLRAQKAGFKCFVAPQFVGTCEANLNLPKWCLPSTPLIKRFKILYSPLSYAEPIPFFIYDKRHFGIATAIKHFFSINLRAVLPHLWK